ncbi:GNAT family N-acetyltransferase [Aquimarina algiphila]|uniref:GNAT family N-acetyltransferase n=1 Tax=Aquimarina algiphila TaxID=2047982 RepID=A0A554VC15_9FLAO|nr:GNAT family N-acetyltransferase [Aquimarina algiphila]TSE04157.1 GNAT family N-acetyltransferase [Aquimarina algiphila]
MISQEIRLVKISLTDSEKLTKIGRQTFYDAFGPPANTEENIQSYLNEKFTLEQITKELQHYNSFFYFAMLDNIITGYIKLNMGDAQTEPMQGNPLEIERIYVLNRYQGRKIGQSLVNESIRIAKEKNADYVWLGVWDQNPGAIRFYQRNGFKTIDSHEFMLGTEIQTDIIMKLEI